MKRPTSKHTAAKFQKLEDKKKSTSFQTLFQKTWNNALKILKENYFQTRFYTQVNYSSNERRKKKTSAGTKNLKKIELSSAPSRSPWSLCSVTVGEQTKKENDLRHWDQDTWPRERAEDLLPQPRASQAQSPFLPNGQADTVKVRGATPFTRKLACGSDQVRSEHEWPHWSWASWKEPSRPLHWRKCKLRTILCLCIYPYRNRKWTEQVSKIEFLSLYEVWI